MASPVEGLKSLRVDKLLITHQHFNLSTFKQKQAKLAFTMAEILLSLTIIGVVAAITLPSLTGNINERTWNTQRKALYSRMSQAISLMPAINGYGVVREESAEGVGDGADTAAETFATAGLAKVLKINNICDNEHLQDCGIVSRISTLNGATIDMPKTLNQLNAKLVSGSNAQRSFSYIDTKAAAFETQNGESVVLFYNPRCIGSLAENSSASGDYGVFIGTKMCANFIYDLNGSKGPNTVGKDIGFLSVMFPSDATVVAPVPAPRYLAGNYTTEQAAVACKEQDSEYRLPNLNEAMSLFVNKQLLLGTEAFPNIWSSTTTFYNPQRKWFIQQAIGTFDDGGGTFSDSRVWCIQR